MSTVDPLLIETIESMLGDLCEPEKVGAAEGCLDADLWKALTESGMATVGLAESAGGSGGTLQDAAAIAKAAGRHAAPVPLTELSIVGGWVCEQAGLPLPEGPVAVVVGNGTRTYWAPVADAFVVVTDEGVAVVGKDAVTLGASGRNYAGEPWAEVTVSGASYVPGPSVAQVHARGALARSLLMAGALSQAAELSVQYCNEREQFGKPIGKFQVLQQYLSQMAGEAAAAEAAADNAVDVVAAGADEAEAMRVIAAAKTVTGRAVGIINKLAHQIHGAIGYTDEHRLQYTTRRLWSWRDEHGSEAEWAAALGRSLAAAGGAALWPAITAWPPATTG